MIYIIDHSTDPQWNLATEEYLFKKLSQPIFRLWRNDASIIVGLHQNAYAEINVEYVRKNNIPVVRRLSGGGAVFHDLGNVNFTFIDNRDQSEDTASMFARFTRPILEAMAQLGIKANLEGRNDLVIDGKKFSGNAVAVYKNRILQHGTLLFSASINNLSMALANREVNFTGKAVKSNRARVTNICEHLPNPMTVEEFIQFLEKFITEKGNGTFTRYDYTPEDLAAIAGLKLERYGRDEWNFGSSPSYGYSKVCRFPAGLLELYMEVDKGIIKDLKFYGNYFFLKETTEIEEHLKGCEHLRDKIEERIQKITLSDYFQNISGEEFLTLFD
jgi:lipoate-protein ligase A